MRIHQDIVGGALFVGIGIFALIYAQRWDFGRIEQMGPGFFPVVLGVLLIVIGLAIILVRFRMPPVEISINPRAILAVGAAVALFALILRPAGLVPTAFLSALVASFGDPATLIWQRLALALFVTVFSALVFVLGLGMNLPLFPAF